MKRPAVSSSQKKALAGLLEFVSGIGRKKRPVVVFDLDDTLLSTDRRHLRILSEFAAQADVRRRDPRGAAALSKLKESRVRYSVTETAQAAGLTDSALLAALKSFWFERFFTNEYLLADHPVPGAAEYCAAALQAGARVVYMTGRDEGMRRGTEASLKNWNFPRPDGRRIRPIRKSSFGLPDLEYKRDNMAAIRALGVVAGSFENEPAHINIFHDSFPEAWHFQVETKHSGRPIEALPGTRRIADFRR